METALELFKKEIGKAFKDYVNSEGCTCCQDVPSHKKAEQELAELLDCPMYADGSGYDWSKL